MPGAEPPTTARDVRSYYDNILPFYEKEVVRRHDVAFWAGLCRRVKPGAVLEVGCGLGAVTRAVASCAPTVGFDLSVRMLRRARSRLLRARLPARLFAADARTLALARRFDLVIAAGDPFSHWTRASDRRAALRAVARHLSREGRFVLDGLYRPGSRPIAVPDRQIGRRGRYRLRERWEPAGPPNLWIAHFEYRRAGAAGPPEAEALLKARAWDPAELERVFDSCGLAVEEVWGDFDRSAFHADSRRILVVARRRRS